MKDQADKLIYAVEMLRGNVTEEEKSEIRLYLAGKELAHLVNLPGWSVALEMLAGYANSAGEDLISMAPGDPRVPQAHAAASATNQLYRNFIDDVARAIEIAKTTPETVKIAYSRMSPAPPELSA